MMPVWIYSGSIGAYLMVMLQKNIVLLDGLFADVQRLCHLLHGEMQPLLTE